MHNTQENQITGADSLSAESDIDKIPIKTPNTRLDVRRYQGFKTRIENVKIVDVINWYTGAADDEGKPTYNPNSKEMMKKVEIETEDLPEIDENGKITGRLLELTNDDGTKRRVKVTARFNLQKDETGEWVISKHQRAKLWKFMRKQGANTLSRLKGTVVVIDVEPSRDENDDRMWMRISI